MAQCLVVVSVQERKGEGERMRERVREGARERKRKGMCESECARFDI